MLAGDNSILQKATDAKTETEKGQEKEIVSLAYNSVLSKKVSDNDSTLVTAEDLNTELTNQGATASGNNPIKVTFTDSKRQYTINSDGTIKYVEEGDTGGDGSTVDKYGDYVQYGTVGSDLDLNGDGDVTNDWRIFYANESGTFIIAADYVPITNNALKAAIASNKANMRTEKGGYDVSWAYDEDGDIVANRAELKISSSVEDKFMFSWLTVSYGPDNNNKWAVASLLDAEAWSSFVTGKATMAIGGPTLEMWVASWNAKEYTKLFTSINSGGYCVGTNSERPEFDVFLNEEEEKRDTLYFPLKKDGSNCSTYWLASPSENYDDNVMLASTPGYVGYTDYRGWSDNSEIGVRPLVFLPSSVQLEKDTNNIWQIK